MSWQPAAQLPPSRPALSTVPEGESVRMAALKAAWARDKWVGRRRIWWRWTLWYLQRYVLPSLAVLAVGVTLWLGAKAAMGWTDTPSTRPDPMGHTAPAMDSSAGPQAASDGPTPLDAGVVSVPLNRRNADGMNMKFEPLISTTRQTAETRQIPVSSAATTAAAKIQHPQLISENWLHSKEP